MCLMYSKMSFSVSWRRDSLRFWKISELFDFAFSIFFHCVFVAVEEYIVKICVKLNYQFFFLCQNQNESWRFAEASSTKSVSKCVDFIEIDILVSSSEFNKNRLECTHWSYFLHKSGGWSQCFRLVWGVRSKWMTFMRWKMTCEAIRTQKRLQNCGKRSARRGIRVYSEF